MSDKGFLRGIYGYYGRKMCEFCKEKFSKKSIDCENKERIIPRC